MQMYNTQAKSTDAIVETHLNKFQQRTGCFVEYAAIFGSSQRGYGLQDSDRDVGFVYDYPHATTLTMKDNIKFKVGSVEFIGTSRAFFLEKLGSSSVHHWLVFLADSSQLLIAKSEPYTRFRECFLGSRSMRQHMARRFIQSGVGQLFSTDHNLGKAVGEAERCYALAANQAMFEDDDAFCAAIKHHLQAIYTIAWGLVMTSEQSPESQDIMVLLGMTELGRKIIPDVERLIRLRRSDIERQQYSSQKGWGLKQWSDALSVYARELPFFLYEGTNNPYASQYDPETDMEYNILEGSDNHIRRMIVEHFYRKD